VAGRAAQGAPAEASMHGKPSGGASGKGPACLCFPVAVLAQREEEEEGEGWRQLPPSMHQWEAA
jgi:hypothetical protein